MIGAPECDKALRANVKSRLLVEPSAFDHDRAFATAIERDGQHLGTRPAHEGSATGILQRGQRRRSLRRQSAPQGGGMSRLGLSVKRPIKNPAWRGFPVDSATMPESR